MQVFDKNYSSYLRNRNYMVSVALSLLALIASLFINFYAGTYATLRGINPVTDIILNNTRVYDLDGVFVYSATFLILMMAFLCLSRPQRIPFVLKSSTLFILIRAAFVTMTHIGPFPGHVPIDPASIMNDFTFGGDLFFSGHTGLPFLMALVYWNDRRLRYLFIAMSIVLGIVVLLAHLHYTIDVASAFFISYGIYHLARIFFKKDEALFRLGLNGIAEPSE